jgi:hypothetical protein
MVKRIALSVILLFCGVVAAVAATGTLVIPKDTIESLNSQLIAAIPEPPGLILLGVGMLVAAYALRRLARTAHPTPAPSEERPE